MDRLSRQRFMAPTSFRLVLQAPAMNLLSADDR